MFDCETLPSSPGLRTRIETLVLLGSICVALDAAPACCDVVADWPDTWMFPGSAAATAARARHKAVVSTSARINFLITPPNSWTGLRRLPQPNVDTSRELAGTGVPVVAQSATARQRGRKDAAQQSEDEERQRAGQRDRQRRRTAAVCRTSRTCRLPRGSTAERRTRDARQRRRTLERVGRVGRWALAGCGRALLEWATTTCVKARGLEPDERPVPHDPVPAHERLLPRRRPGLRRPGRLRGAVVDLAPSGRGRWHHSGAAPRPRASAARRRSAAAGSTAS